MRAHAVVVAVLAAVALTACGSSAPDEGTDATPTMSSNAADAVASPEPEVKTAEAIAQDLVDSVDSATKLVVITEDNDPNDLIGRPNGYVDAAVIYDAVLKCDDLGVGCGATIEIFKDAEAATKRGQYIQTVTAEMPIAGTEWDYSDGSAVLLRVSGDLKPSDAEKYADWFGGELIEVVPMPDES